MSLTRFLVAGQTPEQFGARRGGQWPGLAIRRFLLYEVFLHELGHLQVVDAEARSVRRQFAAETRAQDFAMGWCKTLWAIPFDHPDPVHSPPTPAELTDDDWELSDLIRLSALRPGDAMLAQKLGRAYRRRGRMAEARAAFDRAHTLDPSDPWTVLLLGNWHFVQDDWTGAAEWFRRAAELIPDDATPFWCLAEAAECQRDLAAADTLYRQAVEAEPNNRLARRKLREWQDRRSEGQDLSLSEEASGQ
jgi:tetratricopeptide (TPR) repeat protein